MYTQDNLSKESLFIVSDYCWVKQVNFKNYGENVVNKNEGLDRTVIIYIIQICLSAHFENHNKHSKHEF